MEFSLLHIPFFNLVEVPQGRKLDLALHVSRTPRYSNLSSTNETGPRDRVFTSSAVYSKPLLGDDSCFDASSFSWNSAFVCCVHLRLFSVCLIVQMVEFPLFLYMYIILYRRIAVTTLIEFSSNVELLISWSRCTRVLAVCTFSRVIVVVVHNFIGVYISIPCCILQYPCVGRPKGELPPLAGVAVSACYVS